MEKARESDVEPPALEKDDKADSMSSEESNVTNIVDASSDNLMDWEKGFVGWESLSDSENPLNMSTLRRRTNLVLMGLTSTLAPMGSTLTAPAILQTMADLHEPNQVIGSFSVTIWVLGFAVGPLFLGPLSEMFGRYPVMVASTWFMNAFILGCALAPSMPALIVFRFFAGVGGSAAMTIAPAVCADMYPIERRVRSTAMITMAQCLAPTLGPLIGAFVAGGIGWRWNYWILLILSGATAAAMTFYMKESYAPFLLRKKTERLRKETGREDLQPLMSKQISKRLMLSQAIIRPMKLLTRSVIAMSVCLYISIAYGILYLLFTTIPMVFENQYGWNRSLTGLAYFGLGFGMVICLTIIMKTNDRNVIKLRARNNGVYEPEMRLPFTIYYAAVLPIALFWYGWSIEKHAHWIVPIVGTLFFGGGLLGVFITIQQYMVDTFSIYSASAVAANRAFISIFGATLPLAGPPLYNKLGIGLGNTVLGIIATLMIPIPWIFLKHGKKIRERWPVTL